MWLKLCLLLIYIIILYLLSRMLEAVSWCDPGHSGVLSRQFLDPMMQSVVKLKSLLEHRGVSYDGVVEKSELTTLVEASGPVTGEELQTSSLEEDTVEETNFSSGTHFIEKVEDAKDSVWLVQVVMDPDHIKLIKEKHWKKIKQKVSRFGVRTGILDCSLDIRYCQRRNWRTPVLVLALPSHFEEKASVIMYNFSGVHKETAIMRWIRDKINDKIVHIHDSKYLRDWQNLSDQWLNPEIRAVLHSRSTSAPLFFSALSVKFPGRVKFALVAMNSRDVNLTHWQNILGSGNDSHLPAYMIYSAEGKYTYGMRPGEQYSFSNMELFFKFLYPCLNDIFILSFCVANVMSWLELFITNSSVCTRFRKLVWCIFKYNVMVILLWLPIIGLFQMPYLDRVPLIFLKLQRIFTTSDFGSVLRGDFVFYINNPVYVYISFVLYLVIVTLICKKYRDVEEVDVNWFNYSQMQTLAHLGPNNLLEPVRISGFDIFGSRFSQPSFWLQPSSPPAYIKDLPTWRYISVSSWPKEPGNSSKGNAAVEGLKGGPADNSQVDLHGMGMETSRDSISHLQTEGSLQSPADRNHSPISPTKEASCCCVDNESATSSSKHPHNCQPSTSLKSSLPEHECHASGPRNKISSESEQTVRSESEDGMCKTKEQMSVCNLNPGRPPCHGFPKGYLESHQCVICLDDYAQYTMLCGLPCGHVFHESCIISWLNLDKHFCPVCRWPSYRLPSQRS